VRSSNTPKILNLLAKTARFICKLAGGLAWFRAGRKGDERARLTRYEFIG